MKTLLLVLSGLMIAIPAQAIAGTVNILGTIPSARNPKISGDGKFVAFESAQPLVNWDTNGAIDIYRLELATGQILLASDGVNGIGTAASGPADSTNPSISFDGNVIAYESLAANLVDGDTNGLQFPELGRDVFVTNISQNTIARASQLAIGGGLFEEGDWASDQPSVSADGTLVAFSTGAGNLVPGFNNGGYGICVYNTNDQSLSGVPVPDRLSPDDYYECVSPAISGDGRFVAFQFDVFGSAYGYSKIYRYGLTDGSFIGLGNTVNGSRLVRPSISADGRFTGFDTNLDLSESDLNGENDVYEFDAKSFDEGGDPWIWFSEGSSDSATVGGDGKSIIWNDKDGNIIKFNDQGETTPFGPGLRSSISLNGEIVVFETLDGGITLAQDSLVVSLPPVPDSPGSGPPSVSKPVAAPLSPTRSTILGNSAAKAVSIPDGKVPSTKPVTKPGAVPAVTSAVAPLLTISDVPNQTVTSGFSTAAIPVKIGPVTSALVLKASSSNQTLVPDSGIVLGGSGANRTVTIKAAANKSGPVTITLTVSDGKLTATDTFVLTVTPGKPQNFSVKFTSNGAAQVDGNVTREIGRAKIKDKKGVKKTFTITNTGKTPLRGLRIVRGGLAASDFMVLKLSKKPLAPKKSITFEVVFKAKAIGARQAELQIFSSETPDNPFDLTVSGTGLR